MSGRPFLLWSLRFGWGWKKHFLCTKYKLEVLWNRLRAVLLGGERRGEGEGRGGNCHIKGKEFKINLISQSLSPPKRFTVSMLRLVMRHKESTERVKWRQGRKRVRSWLRWLTGSQLEWTWVGRFAQNGRLWMQKAMEPSLSWVYCVLSICEEALLPKSHFQLLVSTGTFPTVPHSVAELCHPDPGECFQTSQTRYPN